MRFPRQAYWSGLHFLPSGIFLTQVLNLNLLHWQAGAGEFFYHWATRETHKIYQNTIKNENEWTTRRWKYSESLKHNVEQMEWDKKGMHTVWLIPLISSSEVGNITWGDGSPYREVSFGRVRSLGERLGFWVAITILFLDLGASYVSLATVLKCIVCIICVFPSMNFNKRR